jgi:hypothetical protein
MLSPIPTDIRRADIGAHFATIAVESLPGAESKDLRLFFQIYNVIS